MNTELNVQKAMLSYSLYLSSISPLALHCCGQILALVVSLINKANSKSAPPTRSRQATNHASIAVKTEASNSWLEMDMLVRMRYAVISNPILPGIEEDGGIQKLKFFYYS